MTMRDEVVPFAQLYEVVCVERSYLKEPFVVIMVTCKPCCRNLIAVPTSDEVRVPAEVMIPQL